MIEAAQRVRLGVSSCLLGERVRFDGGHKRDAFLVDALGQFVEWMPVCPELESGMGTPREPVRLTRVRGAIHLVSVKSGHDHSVSMQRYTLRKLDDIASARLCGFVLKKDSPSCGVDRVKVFHRGRVTAQSGRGVFAAALIDRCPELPVIDEGRLSDRAQRENFIERVFALARLRALFDRSWTIGQLVAFHGAHEMSLLAHSPGAYRTLGQLVGAGTSLSKTELRQRYSTLFMKALQPLATPRRHVNVLRHLMGHFSHSLDPGSKTELLALIDSYGKQQVPLIVPLTLLKHHIRRLGIPYLPEQVYLDPHPAELMLRNHV